MSGSPSSGPGTGADTCSADRRAACVEGLPGRELLPDRRPFHRRATASRAWDPDPALRGGSAPENDAGRQRDRVDVLHVWKNPGENVRAGDSTTGGFIQVPLVSNHQERSMIIDFDAAQPRGEYRALSPQPRKSSCTGSARAPLDESLRPVGSSITDIVHEQFTTSTPPFRRR